MTRQDPGTQLGRMRLWAPMINDVAAKTGERRTRLIGLMYRETWCGFAPGYSPKGDPCGWGDSGHAFGLFQIDKRYHRSFIDAEIARAIWDSQKGIDYDPRTQAMYACGLLRDAREWFKRSASSVNGDALERAVYAAYNASEYRVYSALMSRQDVDSVTTGKDYSKYVFDLADHIEKDPAYQALWS